MGHNCELKRLKFKVKILEIKFANNLLVDTQMTNKKRTAEQLLITFFILNNNLKD